jgi:hypothetical protein
VRDAVSAGEAGGKVDNESRAVKTVNFSRVKYSLESLVIDHALIMFDSINIWTRRFHVGILQVATRKI